jgi:hypothetical protein
MEPGTPLLHCTGYDCDWAMTGEYPVCFSGTGSCKAAKLLEAEPSDFHDQTLITVTQQINALLQTVPPDPAGRKLSFLHSRLGTFLGWVEHGEDAAVLNPAVTAEADDATLIQALRLKV